MLNDLAKLLCPPCHAMGCVSYADSKSIIGSFGVIADLMERMDFCICDLSAMPHAERIRTYAAHTNRTVLLDMGGVNTGMDGQGAATDTKEIKRTAFSPHHQQITPQRPKALTPKSTVTS